MTRRRKTTDIQPTGNRKRRRRRRFRVLRILIVTTAAIILLAAFESELYFTPLEPLSSAAYGIVDACASVAEDGIYGITQLFSGSSSSGTQQSNFPLTLLVNRWHPLSDDIQVTLISIEDGKSVDSRCAGDLNEMLADCRAAGLSPVIRSAYRSERYQQELFDNKVSRLKSSGLSADDAYNEAMTVVALPGTSEHQTGLALDLVDASYQELDENQENTAVQKWLMQNSWRYGFILRYPTGKSDITGIIYEPWHYRYLGRDMAKAVYESGLCLEEYLNQ